MNKAKIVSAVAGATRKDLKTAGDIIDAFLETVQKALIDGDKVVLNNFGAFHLINCKERKCRNPKTGEELIVPAYKKPSFTAARSFRKLANKKD